AGDVDGNGRTDFIVTQVKADGTANDGFVFSNQTPIATQTSLAAAPNPAEANAPVLFTAGVSFLGKLPAGIVPTGSVAFQVDGAIVGTADVVNGQATLTVPGFALGSHVAIAFYS